MDKMMAEEPPEDKLRTSAALGGLMCGAAAITVALCTKDPWLGERSLAPCTHPCTLAPRLPPLGTQHLLVCACPSTLACSSASPSVATSPA